LLDKSEILISAVTLVDGGGIGEPITNEPLVGFQCWADYLGNMLGPVGCIKKQFSERFHVGMGRIEQHLPDKFAQVGATRLTGYHVMDATV